MTAQHVIILVSVLGGIIGGMGMGGGTLLIPLLTLAAGLEQHLAQSINLIAFVPMSVVALAVHKKNGYVRFKPAVSVAGLAAVGAICGSFISSYAGGYELRATFGAFLIALGSWQLFKAVKQIVQNIKAKNEKKKQALRKTEQNA